MKSAETFSEKLTAVCVPCCDLWKNFMILYFIQYFFCSLCEFDIINGGFRLLSL